MRVAINVASFYVAWFLAVLAAAGQHPVLAAAGPLAAVGVHMAMAGDRPSEAKLLAVMALVGLILEALLM